jgi:hypothetical protein
MMDADLDLHAVVDVFTEFSIVALELAPNPPRAQPLLIHDIPYHQEA